jgi:hypothetical protein
MGWEDGLDLYKDLEDKTKMLRSLRASFFFQRGGSKASPFSGSEIVALYLNEDN